jgi:integrase
MKSGSNIERRGKTGIFYFRRAVPDDLRRRGAPRDLRISLRTNIRAEAIPAARDLNALVDRLFTAIRQGNIDMNVLTKLTPAILSRFKGEMFEHLLGALEEIRDGEGPISLVEAKTAEKLAELSAHSFRHDLAVNDNRVIEGFLEQEIARQSLRVAPGTTPWNQLSRVGKQVMEQVCLADARRYRGDYDDAPSYRALGLPHPSELPAAAPAQMALSPMARRPLSAIYRECREHKIAHKEWKHSTLMSKDVSIRLFKDVIGDVSFDQITADHAAAFDRALREMPAMIGKSVYVNMSAPDAIAYLKLVRSGIESDRDSGRIGVEEAARRLGEPKCRLMEPHTRNKHINALASVFTWARKTMKWGVEDNFAAFRMTRPARRRQQKKRVRLRFDRLFSVLQSPRFSGRKTKSARGQTIPGDLVVKDGLYWAVLLEAFQGCRLDEGAKLRTFEVLQSEGLWCLKFSFDGEEDGRGGTEDGDGKTSASKRTVPMHDTLIRLGLPDHARRMEEHHRLIGSKPEELWLFPELTVSKHHQTRAANLTKRWATYLKTSRLYRRWEDGHALRHTFNDTLLRAGVPDALVKELMGHRREGMTEDTYFTPSTMKELKAELDKLDYGLPLELRDGEWQIAKAVASQ